MVRRDNEKFNIIMNIIVYKDNLRRVDTYVCPLCALVDIAAEGVLCTSYNSKLEQLEEEDVVDW